MVGITAECLPCAYKTPSECEFAALHKISHVYKIVNSQSQASIPWSAAAAGLHTEHVHQTGPPEGCRDLPAAAGYASLVIS